MITPTIHLNGTSREALLDQMTAAATAVFRACEAVNQTCPNARDYYPQGEGAFSRAAREHEARMNKLAEVYRELEALAEAIADAPDRKRRKA